MAKEKRNQPRESGKRKKENNNRRRTEAKQEVHSSLSNASNQSSNGTITFWNNQKLHLILIFALSFVLYANTLTHDYTLDDSIVIIDNDFTKKGFSGISEILSYDTFMGFFGKEKNLVAGGRYRPMSLVTFAVEWQFFGKNPFVSHLINILLYGLLGVILYLCLLKLFNPKNEVDNITAYFLALATTMLFVTHPIHTEAVANIKGRDEIMALLGSLAAFYWSIKYIYTQKNTYLIGTTLVFFAALMSKENSITFLAIVPVALYFFTKEKLSKIGLATVPYFLVAVVFLLIRSSVLGEGATIGAEAQELMNNPFLGLDSNERYGTIFYTLGKYVQLLILPITLTHDYYPRHIPTMTFGDWQVLLSLLVYAGMGLVAVWGLFSHKRAENTTANLTLKTVSAFGAIFYVASLSVVSNLVFSVGTNMSERLVFMPSVGFCLILAALIFHFFIKKNNQNRIGWYLVAAVAVLFSLKTITRNTAWKDNYTLFKTDIQTSVNSAKLNNAMGGISIDEAQKPENAAQKTQLLNDAIGYLTKATEIHPTYANAYLLTGNAFFYQEEYTKSAEFYRYIAQTFDNPNGKNNLFEAGKKLVESQKFAEAIPILEEAKAYNPDKKDIYGNLGAAYGSTNQHQKAIDNFMKVIEIEPNNGKAHLFIGYSYMNLGDEANGNAYIAKGKQLDPSL
jgi:tetratricopeptide (TPR) repeat protein